MNKKLLIFPLFFLVLIASVFATTLETNFTPYNSCGSFDITTGCLGGDFVEQWQFSGTSRWFVDAFNALTVTGSQVGLSINNLSSIADIDVGVIIEDGEIVLRGSTSPTLNATSTFIRVEHVGADKIIFAYYYLNGARTQVGTNVTLAGCGTTDCKVNIRAIIPYFSGEQYLSFKAWKNGESEPATWDGAENVAYNTISSLLGWIGFNYNTTNSYGTTDLPEIYYVAFDNTGTYGIPVDFGLSQGLDGHVYPTFNSAPVVANAPASQSLAYTNITNMVFNCTDDDGDTLTYYTNNDIISINSGTGAITTAQDITDIGANFITLTCGDGLVNTTSSFTLTITDLAPQVSVAPTSQSLYYNNQTTMTFLCTDPESQAITYASNDTIVVIDENLGNISTTQDGNDEGVHTVRLSCSDLTTTTTHDFALTIVTPTPTFSATIGNYSVSHNTDYVNYDFNCSDVASSSITYTQNSTFATINASTGVFNSSHNSSNIGTHSIAVTCSNGYKSVSQIFEIEITNSAPIILSNQFSPLPNDGTQNVTFTYTFNDTDSDTVLNTTKWFKNQVYLGAYDDFLTLPQTEFNSSDEVTIEVTLDDSLAQNIYNYSLIFNDAQAPLLDNISLSDTAIVIDTVFYLYADCYDTASSISEVIFTILTPTDDVVVYSNFASYENNTYRRAVAPNVLGTWTLTSVQCIDTSDNSNTSVVNLTFEVSEQEVVIPPSTGGGGGGTVIIGSQTVGDFKLDSFFKSITIPSGLSRTLEMGITNIGDTDINVLIKPLSNHSEKELVNWITFTRGLTQLELPIKKSSNPFDSQTQYIEYTITVPQGTPDGEYTSIIQVSENGVSKNLEITITVGSIVNVDFLFTPLFGAINLFHIILILIVGVFGIYLYRRNK